VAVAEAHSFGSRPSHPLLATASMVVDDSIAGAAWGKRLTA